MWYRFSSSARLVEQHALGPTGRPAGVHEHDGTSSSGSGGHHRSAGRDEVLVAEVVGDSPSPISTTWLRAAARTSAMLRAKCSAKTASTKTTLVPESGQDELQLLAGEAQIERVDDAGPEESGVVQLEVLVAVARHHRETIVAQAQFAAHAVGEAQHPVGVLPQVAW